MQSEFRRMDLNNASEAELVATLRHLEEVEPSCRTAFLREAQTPAERVMAEHSANQFLLNALFVEALLSDRFDGRLHYCTILSDTFALMIEDIGNISLTLETVAMSEAETRQLSELRDLGLQAADVLVVAAGEVCP